MTSGYSILRTARLSPPRDYRVLSHLPPDLHKFSEQPVAFDLETTSLDPIDGDVRSIAIANDYGTVAIDYSQLTKADKIKLTNWLMQQRLIAHNAVFDVSWLYAKLGRVPKIEACTLVLLKLLTTEGFLGQRWGLKFAMSNILGWKESNEEELYTWLRENKLSAKDMSKAPWDILGKYNALDAGGTWQLYKHLTHTIEVNGLTSSVLNFHQTDFVNLIELLIEQQVHGMTVDLMALEDLYKKLETKIEAKRMEFLLDSRVSEHVKYYQNLVIEGVLKAEPKQHTKSGAITARYSKWEEKLESAKNRIDFNIDSPKQLGWLFYERMFYECPIVTPSGAQSVSKKSFIHLGDLGKLLKDYRELRDRQKFVSSLLTLHKAGTFHPSIKAHGTVTGRSSGGQE